MPKSRARIANDLRLPGGDIGCRLASLHERPVPRRPRHGVYLFRAAYSPTRSSPRHVEGASASRCDSLDPPLERSDLPPRARQQRARLPAGASSVVAATSALIAATSTHVEPPSRRIEPASRHVVVMHRPRRRHSPGTPQQPSESSHLNTERSGTHPASSDLPTITSHQHSQHLRPRRSAPANARASKTCRFVSVGRQPPRVGRVARATREATSATRNAGPAIPEVVAATADAAAAGGEGRSRGFGSRRRASECCRKGPVEAPIQDVQDFSAPREGLPEGRNATIRAQEVRDEEGAAFQVRDVRSCA